MYAVSMSSFSILLGFDVSLILARTSRGLQLFISAVNCKIRMFFFRIGILASIMTAK